MSPWILSRSRVSGGGAGVIKDVAEGLVVERVPGADMLDFKRFKRQPGLG